MTDEGKVTPVPHNVTLVPYNLTPVPHNVTPDLIRGPGRVGRRGYPFLAIIRASSRSRPPVRRRIAASYPSMSGVTMPLCFASMR